MTFLLPTLAMAASVSLAALATIPSRAAEPIVHAVLVHGAVMDGSSWHGVHDALADHGWTVSVVQLPLTSLADDVRATREAIARAPGPLVLVGHSYGGAVISQAGTDPKVARLVYVAATQPDRGESVADLNGRWPMPAHPILLDGNRMIVDRRARHRPTGAHARPLAGDPDPDDDGLRPAPRRRAPARRPAAGGGGGASGAGRVRRPGGREADEMRGGYAEGGREEVSVTLNTAAASQASDR